ncbi:MAG: hypothetical protein JJT96_19565 [Opitutales bacterium]|nr:hypothetical protein [Opitutales bacterium]
MRERELNNVKERGAPFAFEVDEAYMAKMVALKEAGECASLSEIIVRALSAVDFDHLGSREKPKRQMSVRVPRLPLDPMRAAAKREGVSMSYLFSRALQQYFPEPPPEPAPGSGSGGELGITSSSPSPSVPPSPLIESADGAFRPRDR